MIKILGNTVEENTMSIKEDSWYTIICILCELEIYIVFEEFAKKNEFIDIQKDITDMSYDDLATAVQLFLEEETIQIELKKKEELLKFCNMIK